MFGKSQEPLPEVVKELQIIKLKEEIRSLHSERRFNILKSVVAGIFAVFITAYITFPNFTLKQSASDEAIKIGRAKLLMEVFDEPDQLKVIKKLQTIEWAYDYDPTFTAFTKDYLRKQLGDTAYEHAINEIARIEAKWKDDEE